ncbi:MAG: alpha/beta fold hydrolase [Candidatus Bipolaricaulota bacterium]|nr:alpha/beta fold hydrolase [Candidatus Bipolaricaulota bacterium]
MSAKLLLVLGIILGIVLAGFVLLQERTAGPEPSAVQSQLVSSGHFVLEQSGARLLEETYSLFFHPEDGYMLISQGTLTVAGASIGIAQQTQYDPEYRPLTYQLAAATPTGTQIVSAQRGDRGLTMEVRAGVMRQSADVAEVENLVLLDNNVISHYVVLLAAFRAEAVGQTLSAAVPQVLTAFPSRWDTSQSVEFRSGSRTYDGKLFTVHLGDTTIDLVTYDGRLVGLVNRTQSTVAYDIDLLPDGLSFDRAEVATSSADVVEREVSFQSGDVTLVGSFTMPPAQSAPSFAVLFVHGSGPVDRDGNAPGLQMDAYRQLAHALARSGIASLRYDKRGTGSSEGDGRTASRSDLLADVRAAWEALRRQPEIGGSIPRIAVGHSEGAYLVEELAADNLDVDGLVLLCGAAKSLADVTRWQVETLLRQQGATDDQISAAMEQEDSYLTFVQTSAGQWSDYAVEALRDAMPWLTEAAALQLKNSALGLAWLREHYNADPAEVLARVACPVLALNGAKDLQVPPSEGELIAAALRKGGNNAVDVILLDDLNHVLRHHPEEPSLVYQHLDEPVDPRVTSAIVEWVRERSRG